VPHVGDCWVTAVGVLGVLGGSYAREICCGFAHAARAGPRCIPRPPPSRTARLNRLQCPDRQRQTAGRGPKPPCPDPGMARVVLANRRISHAGDAVRPVRRRRALNKRRLGGRRVHRRRRQKDADRTLGWLDLVANPEPESVDDVERSQERGAWFRQQTCGRWASGRTPLPFTSCRWSNTGMDPNGRSSPHRI
jgi:hypothetical protein